MSATAAQLWPQAQQKLTEQALNGTLSDARRREATWLGFELPTPASRPTSPARWAPRPLPVTSQQDLLELAAGAIGVATAAQVYELPVPSPLRAAYDNPDRSYSCKNYVIWAAGRGWNMVGHPFSKYASLSERTAANAARRVRLEQERVAKAQAAAAKTPLPPLTALFYGEGAPVAGPRYATPEQANIYELRRRQAWLTHMRCTWAQGILEVRRRLAAQPEEVIAAWFTEWQRQGHGCYAYLLDFMWQKTRPSSPVPAALDSIED